MVSKAATACQNGIYRSNLHPSIHEIGATAWNALAGTDYPFLRFEFLSALEDSGSLGPDSGWQPLHLALHEGERLVGLLPLYNKADSYGEYVFDWSWAEAYQRHGLAYYPKLLSAVPFTPASGPRLLLAAGADRQAVGSALLTEIQRLTSGRDYSSWHLLFPQAEECALWQAAGLLHRLGCQYHWHNQGYGDFADFLARMSARKRKNIKRERRRVQEQGLELRCLRGQEIQAEQLALFYDFYQATYYKRGRQGYLAPEFFELLRQRMPEQLLLVLAYRSGNPVAGAFYLVGADTLYGRYWGSFEEYPCLHFEACYYQGIDFCIREGLARFDPGAQGEHKILRGFEPVLTHSLHWIEHPAFRQAIERFLAQEERHIQAYQQEARELLPFKQQISL